ncbi:MAG: Ig-like domain-containing protein, partial [Bacteroidales bacterium]|nr:Ig-like domain-containing protein [Bacteroidales bacterium]
VEDGPKTLLQVLQNDEDKDRKGLILSEIYSTSLGTATVELNAIAYTPGTNQYGHDTLFYVIRDKDNDLDTATVIVSIAARNDSPEAYNDVATTDEDQVIDIFVLENDIDIDQSTLRLDSVGAALHGSILIDDDKITYTPATNYFGADSFLYYVKDHEDDRVHAQVKVTINAVSDYPLALDDSIVVAEDNGKLLINVLANDIDVDKSGLSITDVKGAEAGVAVIEDQRIAYTAAADFFGKDTLSYIIKDGEFESDTATLIITVTPTNDAPVALGDVVSTEEDNAVVIEVLLNDTDTDKNILTIDSVSTAQSGSLVFLSDQVTYTPIANFYGRDSFIYYISDADGDVAFAEVKIKVIRVNEIPVANDDNFDLLEDAGETAFDVLHNDSDIDQSGLTIFNVISAQGGTVAISNKQVVYTPIANFYGADTLDYVICDGENDYDTAQVCLHVIQINDLPQASDDKVETDEDIAVSIAVLNNDKDIDISGLKVDSVGVAHNGLVSLIANVISYQPELNFFGRDSFNYFIIDGEGDLAEAMVRVTVNAVNDTPIASPDSFIIQEDAAATLFDIVANDVSVDKNSLHLIEIFDVIGGVAQNTLNKLSFKPAVNFFGEASLNYVITDQDGDKDTAWVKIEVTGTNDVPQPNQDLLTCQEESTIVLDLLFNDVDVDHSGLTIDSVYSPLSGLVTVLNDTLHYTPNYNFCGVDSFRYYVVDGEGDRVASVVKVSVLCINDAPRAVLDSVWATEDIAKVFFPMVNDVDPDDAHFAISFGVPTHGTISNIDANYYYTSDLNFNGLDSVNYTITDVAGLSCEAMVYFTVAEVNDAPVAINDTLKIVEDSVLRFYPLANDSDAENAALTEMTIYREPKLGSYSVQGLELVYTPQANIWGADTITYVTCDSANALSNVATMYINITSVNDVPVAADLNIIVEENVNDTTDVLALATDPDNLGLELISVEGATNGASSIDDQKLVYQPSLDFLGRDTVVYAVRDGQGDITKAEVYYNILSFYEMPVAHNDTLTTLEDVVLTITPTVNDMAVEKVAQCDLIILRSPKRGTYVQDSVTIKYTPNTNIWGVDTMTYVLRDSNRIMSEVASIYITIDSVNEAPIISTVNVQLDEEAIDTTELLNLASDPDFSGLNLALANAAANGVSMVLDSRLAYTPYVDFAGLDTVSFWVIDGDGDTTTSYIYYEVKAINDVPVARNDTLSIFEDNVLSISPMLNDFDIEDSVLLDFSVVSWPILGGVVGDSLNIIYTPYANVWGRDSMTYLVRDAQRAMSEEATIYITIDSVNEAPILINMNLNVTEDKSDTVDVLSAAQDPDFSHLTLAAVSGAQHGVASIFDTKVVYTPYLDFSGKDTVTYYIHDGENDTTAAYLCFTVLSVNDAPTAVNDTLSTLEDNSLVISPLNNDVDTEDTVLI